MTTPSLVFAKADVAALQERAQTPPLKGVWEEIRARADGLCTPDSPWFLDPAEIDAESRSRSKLRKAHLYGKRMMIAAEMLGFAYQMTGERRYARHGVDIVVAAAGSIPVTDERISSSLVGGWGVAMRGFALGLDWLGEAMTADEKDSVQRTGADYVRTLLARAADDSTWWAPNHNFMGVTLGGAGCLALKLTAAFPTEADAWVEACAKGIWRWLDHGFDEQGGYAEGVLYAHFGLENGILFADALERSGGTDLFEHPRLRRVPHFFAMSLLPGETAFDARNDSHYRGLHDPFLLRLAGRCQDGLARWLWDRCGSGCSPLRLVWENNVEPEDPTANEPAAEHFTGRGLCVFRTGWTAADVMFGIEAGPFYQGTHNQADKGQITLYGQGRRWLIDSGYGNNREPDGADQTAAHNLVLIDGQGQALSGAGVGTSGKLTTYQHAEDYDYALADATEAYNHNNRGAPGVGVRHARRHVLFVRPSHGAPAYAVVLDDIDSRAAPPEAGKRRDGARIAGAARAAEQTQGNDGAEHEYTWLLHTDAANKLQLADAAACVVPASSAAGQTAAAKTGNATNTWRLVIEKDGEYVLWAQARATGALVADLFPSTVQVDDEPPLAWYVPEMRRHVWDPLGPKDGTGPLVRRLTAGEHIVRLRTHDRTVDIAQLLATPEVTAESPPEPAAGIRAEPIPCEAAEDRDPAAARMQVLFDPAAGVELSQDAYDEHPRLRAAVRAVRLDLASVLLPLPPDCREPEVVFAHTASGTQLRLVWPEREDHISWPQASPRTPTVDLR